MKITTKEIIVSLVLAVVLGGLSMVLLGYLSSIIGFQVTDLMSTLVLSATIGLVLFFCAKHFRK